MFSMHAGVHGCMGACRGAWVHACRGEWVHGCMQGCMLGVHLMRLKRKKLISHNTGEGQ